MKKLSTSLNLKRNANQTQRRLSPHWSEWPLLKSPQTINAGEGGEKRKPPASRLGNLEQQDGGLSAGSLNK